MALVAGLATRCGGSVVPTMPESPIGPPWTVAAKIDPAAAADGYDDYPRLGVSRRGDVVAVWAHHVVIDGRYVRNGLRTSRFFPESGWDPISTIPGIDDEYGESIAMDDDGLAIVVGTIADWSLPHQVWATRARPGSPWSALELVPPGPGDAQSPRVVLPLPGLAVVTWLGADGTHGRGWSSVHDGGWTPAQPLSLLGNFRIYSPNLVTDGNGHALATWFEPPGFDEGPVFANVFQAGRGWTGERFVGPQGRAPVGGLDASGRALVAWTTLGGLMMSRLSTPDALWTAATRGPGSYATDAHIAMNEGGDALAVWAQQNGSGRFEVWAATWTASLGWGPARLVGPGGGPQVMLDATGRGAVVWDGDGRVYARTYLPRTGWDPIVNLGPGSRAVAGSDGGGIVTAVWSSEGAIWFARLNPHP